MPKTPDATSMLKNWQAGMAGGQQKFRDAIQRVNVNPMALAAQKVEDGTYLAKVNEAVSSGRMVAALNAADPSFWKQQTAGAGAAAWAAGAAKGAPKYQRKAQQLAQAAAAGSAAASQVSGSMEKVRANINAFRQAFGKPTI